MKRKNVARGFSQEPKIQDFRPNIGKWSLGSENIAPKSIANHNSWDF